VIPLYMRYTSWAYSKDQFTEIARIIAYDPRRQVLNIPEINAQRGKLSMPFSFLFDRLSRGPIEPIARKLETQATVPSFANNRRVTAVGLFSMGNSMILGGEGNMIATESTYGELFGDDALQTVTIGILQLKPGANVEAVKLGIKQTVPGIQVLTHTELIEKELTFQSSNPTGVIFGFGAGMGFVVGIVVVYQVLYADVSDHLAEYATLKAMGYSDRALLLVIFQESTFLAAFGYIPGFGISFWMYQVLAGLTKLPLIMLPSVAIAVFCLTFVMCTCSAIIASGKLRSADPADVF
jgi:putative ABC transport system permease protein